MKPAGKNRGFTLFEVLIAVSIFAIIGVIAMSNLIQVGRSGERIEEADRQLSRLQYSLARIGKDVMQLVPRPVRDRYGDEQAVLKIDGERLQLTRGGWSNLLQQPRSNLQRVEYRLVEQGLQRRFSPILDQGYEENTIDQLLLEGVKSLRWRLLTRGKKIHEHWPVEDRLEPNQLPVALELRMEVTGFGAIERIYELPQGAFGDEGDAQ